LHFTRSATVEPRSVRRELRTDAMGVGGCGGGGCWTTPPSGGGGGGVSPPPDGGPLGQPDCAWRALPGAAAGHQSYCMSTSKPGAVQRFWFSWLGSIWGKCQKAL